MRRRLSKGYIGLVIKTKLTTACSLVQVLAVSSKRLRLVMYSLACQKGQTQDELHVNIVNLDSYNISIQWVIGIGFTQ